MTNRQDRLFSDAELDDMGRRSFDKLLERIEEGDREGAASAASRMFNEFESMHRLYRRWVAATLTFIVERDGEDILAEAMEAGVRAWWTPNLEKLVEGSDDLAQQVRWFASGLRGHLVGLRVEEDDEKVVIQMTPCGSGGRLLAEGAYEGDDAFASLPPSPKLTYGLEDCPVYCAHQPLMELLSLERYGWPFVVVEPATYCTTRGAPTVEGAQEHCAFIIYKDRKAVPDRCYERLGIAPPGKRREDDG